MKGRIIAACAACLLSGPALADVRPTPEQVHKLCDLSPGTITDIKSLIYCDDLREQAGMKPLYKGRPLEHVMPRDTMIDLGPADWPSTGPHMCRIMRCWDHATHSTCQAQTFVSDGPC